MKKYGVLRLNSKGEVIGNCGVVDKNWMLNTIYKEIDYFNDDGYDDEEYAD